MTLTIKTVQYDNGYVHVEFSHGVIAHLGPYGPPLPPITTSEFAQDALRQLNEIPEIAHQIKQTEDNVRKAIELYLEDHSEK